MSERTKPPEYDKLITDSKKDLEEFNTEILKASKEKLFLIKLFLIVGSVLICIASFLYQIPPTNNKDAEQSSLIKLRQTIKEERDNLEKKIPELERIFLEKSNICTNQSNSLYRLSNPVKASLPNEETITLPLLAYSNYLTEKEKRNWKCTERDISARKVQYAKERIEKKEKSLIKINSVITSLRKHIWAAYTLFFFSIISLLASILSFSSYANSKQTSVTIRLKINQLNKFLLASTQCDILYEKEDDPDALINKLFEKLEIPVTSNENNSKGKNKNNELFTFLGKLKIPQRKSVEARTDLIKKISEYRENA